MGGRGQASRSSGNSRGGQTLSYKNAVMPQRRTNIGGQLIRANSDFGRDIATKYQGNGVPVYTRNSSGRLVINRAERNIRRETARAEARDRESQIRRERAERELWNTAFTNMFRR